MLVKGGTDMLDYLCVYDFHLETTSLYNGNYHAGNMHLDAETVRITLEMDLLYILYWQA